jgi:1,4-dihydroxy-2-naphthoyl-CoA hydrolase
MSTPIWFKDVPLAAGNARGAGSLIAHLGIELLEAGPDYLKGRMPVDARTVQPAGVLHGGASVALAETLASWAATFVVDPAKHYCVGLEINANHTRAVRDGHVIGTARALHLGRRTQVWEVLINDDAGRLVCVSRVTMAVLDGANPYL